jgi:hypothetical protein
MLVTWHGAIPVHDGRQSVLVHANLLGLEEEEIGVYE